MSNEIKNFFLGKECRNCEALGVTCSRVGVLTFGVPAENGQVAIYIDGKAVLRTTETTDECPAITGQETNKAVVAKLRKTAKQAAGRFTIDQIGNY